ncbi:kxDL motif-containing protein 1-like [Branchiostoma lanceolatum]|uniref:KxDL motif-containing protein 1 n=1 Tax=Branchiostoma lanceolatum TaxID=7740 RepID=A0A8J9ZJN8_BRALA|nr:KXD1 [Branchiostoma lanceolatum]
MTEDSSDSCSVATESSGVEVLYRDPAAGDGGGIAKEPSDVFLRSLEDLVNDDDVNAVLQAQRHMVNRFEKTNEMLQSFNTLSSIRFDETQEMFKKHTQTLLDMKKDLDHIFRRIRELKGKVSKQYPEAFQAAEVQVRQWEESAMTPISPLPEGATLTVGAAATDDLSTNDLSVSAQQTKVLEPPNIQDQDMTFH